MTLKFLKGQLHVLVGWGVSAAFSIWLYATTEWNLVGAELKRSDYRLLVPLTLVLLLHFSLRGFRWRYLLPEISERSPSTLTLLNSMMLGNFASIVLPLRAGEFVRPYVLSLHSGYSFIVGFVSVIVERIFDLAVVLLFFALMVQAVPGVPQLAFEGAYALSVLALGMMVAVAIAAYKPVWVGAITHRLTGLFPARFGGRINGLVDTLLHGVTPLRLPANLAKTVAFSLLLWGATFVYYDIGLRLLGIEGSFWMSIAVSVMIALAVAFPSAPGFIGVFQAGTIAGLAMFDVSKESATAYSIVVHLHQILVVAIWGVTLLLTGQVKFSVLQRARFQKVS